jgi:hypothetical protein
MKVVLPWDEFVLLCVDGFQQKYPDLSIIMPPAFKKDYGPHDGGIGDAYEAPTEVWIEVSQ